MSDVNEKGKNVSTRTDRADTEEKSLEEQLEALEVEEKELVFLYDDDEVNPNFKKESDQEQQEKKEKKTKLKKQVYIALGTVAGVLLLVYLGFAFYFNSHFYFSTTINGNAFGMKSVKDVESFMMEQVAGYELTLLENDQTTEKISGKDISLEYRPGNELEKAVKEQNPFLWPKSLFWADDLEIPIGVEYNKDTLKDLIAKLGCVTNEDTTESVAATPVFDGNAFEVQKEVIGNVVDVETFTALIEEHLNGFLDTLHMEEKGCYYLPKYFSDSQEVIAAKDKMNQYLAANVTYEFKPYTESVDKKVISEWLTVDEDMQVIFQKEKVKEYIKSLADKYDTSGKPRSFVTANGNTVQVKNGIYGWKINQEEEYNKLIANIEAGETVTREPEYRRRAISHEGNDFGNTYAEVDLTAQKMWFFKDGQMMMESQVVTGNPNKGNGTPQGTYTVTYTQRKAVLKGRLRPDGTREYESPVDYWMPFNGGIGFHDATWQSSFGGNRYLTHGSHGCVNMPLEKAKQLFGYLKAGTPVICHY